jgi:glycolate oxidase FAD binding subunit
MESHALPNLRSQRPSNEAELVEQINAAISTATPVFAHGGRTKNNMGPWPSAVDAPQGIALSMESINGIIDYEPADMVVTVSAGMRLTELQRILGKHRQWLPVDPPFEDATIGGILATGSAGPRRQFYGSLKDHILGMRVLGPRGAITKSGGRVVKNVAGFDLHRLHIGAFGTLGIIVDASFKVNAITERSAASVVSFDEHEKAHAFLLEVAQSSLRPVALELIYGDDVRRLASLDPKFSFLENSRCVAIVGAEGTDAFVARHKRDLARMTPTAASAQWFEDAQPLWASLCRVPSQRPSDAVCRLGSKPHHLPALLSGLSKDLGLHIHVGIGVARIVFDSAKTAQQMTAVVQDLSIRAAALGGYAVMESAPIELANRSLLPFSNAALAASSSTQLCAQLRQTWDPKHLFHRNRACA